MKASKFIVLVGGLLGILAFFLPLVSVTRAGADGEKATATLSAFQVVRGIDAVNVQVDKAGERTDVRVKGEDIREAKGDLDSVKGIVMACFAPALLLALIGGLGVARKKFGRGAGAFALILGLLGLGIGMILKGAAEGDSGIGLTFLILTGVSGILGGILGLAKPERLAPAAA